MIPPPAADLAGLGQVGEGLLAEHLVPEPAVEALRIRVLPRRPRLDVQRLHARLLQEPADGLRDEFRPVVAAGPPGGAADQHQLAEHVQHVPGLERPADLQRLQYLTQRLPGVQQPVRFLQLLDDLLRGVTNSLLA